MKIVKKGETVRYEHGKTCVALEYPINDKDINVAVIELDGRYPEKGQACNAVSKELAFVVKGSGKVVINGREIAVTEGDLTFIDPGEKFYWEGKMTLVMPCTPAWTSEQYKIAE
ncbi:MAG: cupin domain-containing protein [Candidatus Pacebacteria bacterium]|jgi:mannose-6-phosphate isomerase-like protein (cupin superfamily)|nr:cupin domain-containing protein [Candidatus Paceibacterota bacterium]